MFRSTNPLEMIGERQLMINALKSPEATRLLNQQVLRTVKRQYDAHESRKEAEAEFRKQPHTDTVHSQIWKSYSGSISCAPNNSEDQALGYDGRSAYFLHVGKHEECLRDIERALAVTKTASTKVKLLCRKAECLVALDRPEKKSAWEKAKFWLGKVKDRERAKTRLTILVNDTKDLVEKGKPDGKKESKHRDIVELLSKKESEDPFQNIAIL